MPKGRLVEEIQTAATERTVPSEKDEKTGTSTPDTSEKKERAISKEGKGQRRFALGWLFPRVRTEGNKKDCAWSSRGPGKRETFDQKTPAE